MKYLISFFLLINFAIKPSFATEVEYVVTFSAKSYAVAGGMIATSSEPIITEYNTFQAAKYSACMMQLSSMSHGSCSYGQAYDDRPVPESKTSFGYTQYVQTLVLTSSNKSWGVVNTITTNDVISLYGVSIYCPSGTIPKTYGERSTCLLEETPNHCTAEGNPINYLSGEKIQEEMDFTSPKGLSVKRRYVNQRQGWEFEKTNRLVDKTSRFSDATYPSKVTCDGYLTTVKLKRPDSSTSDPTDSIDVWSTICLRYLKQANGVESVILISADGTRHDFYASGVNFYSNFFGAKLELINPDTNSGYAWVLRFKNGQTEYFDKRGLLKKSVSQDANVVVYHYDDDLLIRKENLSGESVRYEYNEAKQISKVYLPGLKEISYQYTNQPFSNIFLVNSATYSNNTARQYLYENVNFPLALTGIVDENGLRYASWSYDTQGRAISSQHYGGTDLFTFDYSQADRTTVTNPLGKKTTYTFATINGKKVITHVDGIASANCGAANQLYEYYPEGWLKSKTDWKGIQTTYQYNTLGQEISRTEAFGTTDARTITTEWHPTLYVKTKVTEPGKETLFNYDANGRLLNQSTNVLSN